MVRYLLLCCLWCYGFSTSLHAQTNSGQITQKLHITDTRSNPIFGVYVIHKAQSWLITTTDIDGECEFRTDWFSPEDTIQFQGMGYKVITYTIAELKHLRKIQLEDLNFLLDETIVTSISMEELLNKAMNQMSKPIRNQVPLCRFYGRSQYEKLRNTVTWLWKADGNSATISPPAMSDVKTSGTKRSVHTSFRHIPPAVSISPTTEVTPCLLYISQPQKPGSTPVHARFSP